MRYVLAFFYILPGIKNKHKTFGVKMRDYRDGSNFLLVEQVQLR